MSGEVLARKEQERQFEQAGCMGDKDYPVLLLEGIRDQNEAVPEAVADVPTCPEIAELRQDVTELTEAVKIVKAVVIDVSLVNSRAARQETKQYSL